MDVKHQYCVRKCFKGFHETYQVQVQVYGVVTIYFSLCVTLDVMKAVGIDDVCTVT